MGETQTKPTGGLRGRLQRRAHVVDLLAQVLPIPEAPVERLMTFEELQQKIGSKPKKDRFGGLKKMSTRYKALGQQLDRVRSQVHDLTVGDLDTGNKRTQVETDVGAQLDEIRRAGEAYRKKHTGKKGNVVKALLEDVERFRGELPALLLRLGTPEKAWPKELTLDSAMAAERLNIKPERLALVSPKHCRFAEFSDEQEKGFVELGKGKVNAVQLIDYGGQKRVFKKEQTEDKSGAWLSWSLEMDTASGIRYGNRNVASGVVSKLLGSSVIPETSFGVHNGEIGIMMTPAPGKTVEKLFGKGTRTEFLGGLSPEALGSLQRQLIELEVCDILTGQGDRHQGNYMVDVTDGKVTVTGIDNDYSYGTASDGGVPKFVMGTNAILNMPRLIGKDMADKVLALDFDRDVAPQYDGLLTDREIAGAKHRHVELQKHVRKLQQDGYVVQDWVNWRSPDNKDAWDVLVAPGDNDARPPSMLARDFS